MEATAFSTATATTGSLTASLTAMGNSRLRQRGIFRNRLQLFAAVSAGKSSLELEGAGDGTFFGGELGVRRGTYDEVMASDLAILKEDCRIHLGCDPIQIATTNGYLLVALWIAGLAGGRIS